MKILTEIILIGCSSNTYWRADCSFNELKNLLFEHTAGITYMDAYLSNMVRAGQLTREEALARTEKEGAISRERLKIVFRVLGLSEEVLNEIYSEKSI